MKNVASIIIHNFPINESLEIMLDNSVWKIGSKFKGFRNTPSGAHLLSFTVNTPKMGPISITKIIYCSPNDLLILEFNEETFEIEDLSPSNPLHEMYKNAFELSDLNAYLAEYKIENYTTWKLNTNKISKRVINKVVQKIDKETKSNSEKVELVENKEVLNSDLESPYKFTQISLEAKNTPKDCFLDRSKQLIRIINFEYDSEGCMGLLGEFQLAFVLFIVFENPDALLVWQKIAFIFCESENFMVSNLCEFCEFLKVFFLMLKQLPSDFFYHQLTNNHFLIGCIRHLMENLMSDQKFGEYFRAFDDLMQNYFKFEYKDVLFSDDGKSLHANELLIGDELPVLVEENQKFISFD